MRRAGQVPSSIGRGLSQRFTDDQHTPAAQGTPRPAVRRLGAFHANVRALDHALGRGLGQSIGVPEQFGAADRCLQACGAQTLEFRQYAPTDRGPQARRVRVGPVFCPFKARGAADKHRIGPPHARREKRADQCEPLRDAPIARSGAVDAAFSRIAGIQPDRQGAAGRNARKPAQARAPEQVHQHCFEVIVGMVRSRDEPCTAHHRFVRQGSVPQPSRDRLEVPRGGPSLDQPAPDGSVNRDLTLDKLDTQAVAQRAGAIPVSQRLVSRAQVVQDMHRDQPFADRHRSGAERQQQR